MLYSVTVNIYHIIKSDVTHCWIVCWLPPPGVVTPNRARDRQHILSVVWKYTWQHDVTWHVDEKCYCTYKEWVNYLFCVLTLWSSPGLPVLSGMLTDWCLKEHGETPTLTGLWETDLRVLRHWDLWLPLETLPAFPRRQLQGKTDHDTKYKTCLVYFHVNHFLLLPQPEYYYCV